MKKFLFLCAAMVAAMSANAAITTMTCAQAKQYTLDNLQAGQTGTDSIAVTGYVTYTDGVVSSSKDGKNIPQQVFWLDDAKGATKTFQAYWCNLPSNEALNVGDKVTIKGFPMNYSGTTAEMKNGDTEILEKVVVERDTLEATICEVIEEGEALNNQEITNDYFIVEGIVSSVASKMNDSKQENFYLTCEDNEKQLYAYKAVMEDGVEAMVGDKVTLMGKIQNYNNVVEIIAGTAKVLEKGNVKIDTIKATVAEAVAAGKALEKGKTSVAVYIVEGYCDSIVYNFSEKNKNMSFYMCDDMAHPTYEFEAYKVSTDQDVTVGTKVYVVGNLYHYYKAAAEGKPEVETIEISEGKLYFADPQGIENIVLTEKAQKVVVDGVIYIVRDNKMFNLQGAQVR